MDPSLKRPIYADRSGIHWGKLRIAAYLTLLAALSALPAACNPPLPEGTSAPPRLRLVSEGESLFVVNDSRHAVDVGMIFDVPLRREFEVEGRWQPDSEWCDHRFLSSRPLRLEPGERIEASVESENPASDLAGWRGPWRLTVPVWREDGTWERVVCAERRTEGQRDPEPARNAWIASDAGVSLRVLEVRSEAREVRGHLRPDFVVALEIVNDSNVTLVLNPTSSKVWCEEDGLWLQHRFQGCGNTEMVYVPPHATLRREITGCGAGWFRAGLIFESEDGWIRAATEPFFVEHAGGIGRHVVRAEAAVAAPAEPPR